MKKMIIMSVIVFALLSSALSIQSAVGDGPSVPTHGLTIEQHWLDIFQQDDHNTFYVEEYIFFNNSGASAFNGTIYAWMPDGSVVRSTCCGNAPDMGCRMKSFGFMDCFTINWQDDNIIYGDPFESSFLSHFGQRETLTINAQSQNYSDTDTLAINVTIGGESEAPSISVPIGPGIHVTADRKELGLKAIVIPGMPANLTLTQMLNVTNNGTGNDTIDLDVLGLPQSWSASFIYENNEINSLSLNLTENKSILLQLRAPSYIGEILISYTINLPVSGQDKLQTVLEKQLLYDNNAIESFIFTLEDTNITVSDDLNLHYSQWNAIYNMTMHFVFGSDLPSGTVISLAFSWEEPVDLTWLALLAVAVIFAMVIAFVALGKRKKKTKEIKKEKSKEISTEAEEEAETIAQKEKSTEKALERLEVDYKKGLLPDNIYNNMMENLKRRDVDLRKKLEKVESAVKTTLKEEKEKMLLAIKQLEKDHKSGKISDEVYNKLYDEYKRRTIEIMKEIDTGNKA